MPLLAQNMACTAPSEWRQWLRGGALRPATETRTVWTDHLHAWAAAGAGSRGMGGWEAYTAGHASVRGVW